MSTTTLTDRYLGAALKHVPEAQRPEIERELRSSIDDALEPRLEAGEPRDAAERAVLQELGDPERLANTMIDRPMTLIGPRVFLLWKRMLTLGVAVIVPLSAAGSYIVQALVLGDLVEAIGHAVWTAVTVTIHVGFWVTLAFAIVERSADARRSIQRRWSVEQLPSTAPMRRDHLGEAITQLVMLGILIALLVWQQFNSFLTIDGSPVPLFDPSLWTLWWPIAIVLSATTAIVQLVRRYDLASAWLNLGSNLIVTSGAAWLIVTGRAWNPAYVDEALGGAITLDEGFVVDLSDTAVVGIGWMTAAFIVVGGVISVIQGFWRARRPKTLLVG